LDVVGASRPPSEVDVTAPLLPESGAARHGTLILAGLVLVMAGVVLRKRHAA
jgi:LPXTG-motif cell wall-anchored protein